MPRDFINEFLERMAEVAGDLAEDYMREHMPHPTRARSQHSPPRDVRDQKRAKKHRVNPGARGSGRGAAMTTAYHILQVHHRATAEVITAAYKALAKQYHPDRCPGDKRAENMMKLVNQAHDILSDPEKRKAYDRSIGL